MRRQTKEVKIGSVTIGGENPIAIQSMLCAPLGDLAPMPGRPRLFMRPDAR